MNKILLGIGAITLGYYAGYYAEKFCRDVSKQTEDFGDLDGYTLKDAIFDVAADHCMTAMDKLDEIDYDHLFRPKHSH